MPSYRHIKILWKKITSNNPRIPDKKKWPVLGAHGTAKIHKISGYFTIWLSGVNYNLSDLRNLPHALIVSILCKHQRANAKLKGIIWLIRVPAKCRVSKKRDDCERLVACIISYKYFIKSPFLTRNKSYTSHHLFLVQFYVSLI